MTILESVAISGLAAVLAAIFVRASIPVLERLQLIDRPGARSSHVRPTPRGGGAGLLLAAALAAIGGPLAFGQPFAAVEDSLILFALAFALAVVCVIDDARSLSPWLRLAAQFGCVAAALSTLGPSAAALVGPWAPAWLVAPVVAIGWVWFINLFNFMDGVDGIAGAQAAVIGIAIAIAGATIIALAAPATGSAAAAIAGASLGFLIWNWSPARVFMGDVGSAPLGFLLGALMLQTAAAGAYAVAILPALFFMVDATATLLRRLIRRETVWRAHREHAYQRAARRFGAHAPVSRRFAAGAIGLSVIALALDRVVAPAIALAVVVPAAAVVYVAIERLAGPLE